MSPMLQIKLELFQEKSVTWFPGGNKYRSMHSIAYPAFLLHECAGLSSHFL